VFAFGNELARTLTDALARRTMVGLDGAAGLDTALAAAEVCGEVLGWSDERIAQEIEAYHRFAQRLRPRALRNG
jgi:glycerol-3-phosphate dehydrogenase